MIVYAYFTGEAERIFRTKREAIADAEWYAFGHPIEIERLTIAHMGKLALLIAVVNETGYVTDRKTVAVVKPKSEAT